MNRLKVKRQQTWNFSVENVKIMKREEFQEVQNLLEIRISLS